MPLQRKRSFQRLYRTKSYPSGHVRKEPQSDTDKCEWCLVDTQGDVHRLPKTMIFLGKEECDIEVQTDTVDKRHAVVTFDAYLHRFKIKDLSTNYGTFVNSTRIPEQEYVTLDQDDFVQLGQDPVLYKMEKYQEKPNTINNHEEQVVFTQSDHDLPSWATNNHTIEDVQSPIAECEGCIAEQRIEHTCGEDIPESEAAHRDLDRSYSHDSIASFSLGCNTWPKKRHKPKKNVKDIFAMVDSSPPPIDSIMEQPQTRVLRGTGAPMNNLPDELKTVKKGTPLYGQPEWWGEEDSDLSAEKQRASKVMEVALPDNPADSNGQARTNVSNNTSDTAGDQSMPSLANQGKPSDHEGVTNMAFTVDFGDETSKNVGGKSLSEFMPTKIRKSFRERKEKSLEKPSSTSKSLTKVLTEPAKLHSKDKKNAESLKSSPKDKVTLESKSSFRDKMTPEKYQAPKGVGRAQSEGRDFSPTRQHKLDELWSGGSSSSESVLHKRQRMMGKSAASRSMDLESEAQGTPDTKATKTSTVKRRTPASAGSKPKSVIRARKAVSQEILASSTQYNNEHAVYLIDKMFQNNSTGSVDSLKTKDPNTSLTEYDLYHEAIKFDVDQSKLLQQDISVSSSFSAGKDTKNMKTRSKEVPTVVQKKSKDADTAAVIDSVVRNEDEDRVSESGTYTIEEEKDSKEEEEARRNIDKVFGVDQLSCNGSLTLLDDLTLMHRTGDKKGDLTLNLQNLNSELEEIEKLERLRAQRPPADSLEVDIGSREPSDLLEEDYDNPSVPSDAPTWVTQWAALTNKKPQNKSDMELSSPGSSISDGDSRSNGKTPNGLSRKRPGTGRRLPTIPPEATSPATSDRSLTKESPQTPKSDLSINGTMLSPGQRSVKLSSHVSSRYQDTDTESVSLTKVHDDSSEAALGMSARGKTGSNGSVVSIDTEVLLRDTETVMAAMQQRVDKSNESDDYENGDLLDIENLEEISDKQDISHQSVSDNTDSYLLNDSVDLESDTSSVVALVNGDEDFVKQSLYKSPRDVLGRGKLKLAESLPSKPLVNLSGAKTRNSVSDRQKRRSVDERTVVSDIYSEDNVTDRDDTTQFSRQGSKGKGQMSMTRPNRAFALRRARADADDGVETSRSTSQLSIASTGFSTPRGSGSLTNVSKVSTTPQKPRRPMSGKFADRQPDSARSQASLGAQIVQKSRENQSVSQSQNLSRTDGGRHSLRVSRSMSIPSQPSPGSSGTKQRKSTGGATPQNLQHSKSLRVTGVGARERSSSLSKHSSGNNSPKTAERNAWKRRKDYDPRKAVAEAKSKSREASKQKTRESNSYHRARGVTRSASFNNAKDLKLSSYQCDSLSSADEYSRRSSGVSDVFDDEPRRGFVPYSGRSIISSKVSNSSADDDELDKYVRSSSTVSTQAKQVVTMHMSAFTPPPHKPIPLSVYKPSRHSRTTTQPQTRPSRTSSQPPSRHVRTSSQPPSRTKIRLKTPEPAPSAARSTTEHRRSVDSLVLYKSVLGRKTESAVKESPRVPESYDTLIVSSVYQLSVKLKSLTDRTMQKLRDTDIIENGLDSPLDDLENQSAISEIPAYKSANQELAGVLKNLRKLEQHIKVMNRVLFPDEEQSPDTSKEKHEYMQQIERIRNELAGFQPIETPREDVWKQTDTQSVESDCEELSHGDYY